MGVSIFGVLWLLTAKRIAAPSGAEKVPQTQKAAFITGISRGLGKAIAVAFCKHPRSPDLDALLAETGKNVP
jgi:hypothetical protein